MGTITDFFDSFDARFEAITDINRANALAETDTLRESGTGTAMVSAPQISQVVNFNQPVESEADVADRMRQISEELAAMIG